MEATNRKKLAASLAAVTVTAALGIVVGGGFASDDSTAARLAPSLPAELYPPDLDIANARVLYSADGEEALLASLKTLPIGLKESGLRVDDIQCFAVVNAEGSSSSCGTLKQMKEVTSLVHERTDGAREYWAYIPTAGYTDADLGNGARSRVVGQVVQGVVPAGAGQVRITGSGLPTLTVTLPMRVAAPE